MSNVFAATVLLAAALFAGGVGFHIVDRHPKLAALNWLLALINLLLAAVNVAVIAGVS